MPIPVHGRRTADSRVGLWVPSGKALLTEDVGYQMTANRGVAKVGSIRRSMPIDRPWACAGGAEDGEVGA